MEDREGGVERGVFSSPDILGPSAETEFNRTTASG